MTNLELLEWVKDPARSREELQAAASGLELNNSGTKDDLRNRVIATLCSTDHSATAAWSPPVTVSPGLVVTPIPRKEEKMMNERSKTVVSPLGAIAVLIAVLALILAFLAWDNSRSNSSSNTASPPQVIVVPGSTNASSDSSGSTDSSSSNSGNISDTTGTTTGASGTCGVIHEYELSPTLLEVSTHNVEGYWIHVQFFVNGGPEMETVLQHGRYTIDRTTGGPRGFVWELGPNCSQQQVIDDMNGSIARRQANNVNTVGVAPQSVVDHWFHKVA